MMYHLYRYSDREYKKLTNTLNRKPANPAYSNDKNRVVDIKRGF